SGGLSETSANTGLSFIFCQRQKMQTIPLWSTRSRHIRFGGLFRRDEGIPPYDTAKHWFILYFLPLVKIASKALKGLARNFFSYNFIVSRNIFPYIQNDLRCFFDKCIIMILKKYTHATMGEHKGSATI
ncbi:MAG: hypothetical protein MJ102_08810, partial [Clostridia bacterium]|nr:hypothetical protein [Clostridia bacterium]